MAVIRKEDSINEKLIRNCPSSYKEDPVLFCVIEGDVEEVKREFEELGWHKIIDFTKDSSFSYQKQNPIIPRVNGFLGRDHIRGYEEDGIGIVTFHVDTPLPHAIDKDETQHKIQDMCRNEIKNFQEKFDLTAPNCSYPLATKNGQF